jgi:hypothetical protein
MIASLLTFLIVGFIALIALSVMLTIVGLFFSLALGLAGFLLFKVAPILLIGWLIVKLVQRSRGRSELSASDRKWLDG